MAEIPDKLVVRTEKPRRWLARVALLLLAAMALLLAYEGGRYAGGFDVLAAARQRSALERRIDRLEHAQHGLQVQLAAAEQARIANLRERSEVARTIGELQAQVERQQQDIEFYRGLVTEPGAQAAVAVRVEQFHITALASPQQYTLRFNLNSIVRPGERIRGTLGVSIEGTRAGAPYEAPLTELADGTQTLPFDFRYYANIEQPVTLPADFKPDRVTIEVRPAGKGVAPYRQTFVWSVDPG